MHWLQNSRVDNGTIVVWCIYYFRMVYSGTQYTRVPLLAASCNNIIIDELYYFAIMSLPLLPAGQSLSNSISDSECYYHTQKQ